MVYVDEDGHRFPEESDYIQIGGLPESHGNFSASGVAINDVLYAYSFLYFGAATRPRLPGNLYGPGTTLRNGVGTLSVSGDRNGTTYALIGYPTYLEFDAIGGMEIQQLSYSPPLFGYHAVGENTLPAKYAVICKLGVALRPHSNKTDFNSGYGFAQPSMGKVYNGSETPNSTAGLLEGMWTDGTPRWLIKSDPKSTVEPISYTTSHNISNVFENLEGSINYAPGGTWFNPHAGSMSDPDGKWSILVPVIVSPGVIRGVVATRNDLSVTALRQQLRSIQETYFSNHLIYEWAQDTDPERETFSWLSSQDGRDVFWDCEAILAEPVSVFTVASITRTETSHPSWVRWIKKEEDVWPEIITGSGSVNRKPTTSTSVYFAEAPGTNPVPYLKITYASTTSNGSNTGDQYVHVSPVNTDVGPINSTQATAMGVSWYGNLNGIPGLTRSTSSIYDGNGYFGPYAKWNGMQESVSKPIKLTWFRKATPPTGSNLEEALVGAYDVAQVELWPESYRGPMLPDVTNAIVRARLAARESITIQTELNSRTGPPNPPIPTDTNYPPTDTVDGPPPPPRPPTQPTDNPSLVYGDQYFTFYEPITTPITPVITDIESPYTFSVISGSLPTGLSIDQFDGGIAGTPTKLGTKRVTVRCVGLDHTQETTFSITIYQEDNPPPDPPKWPDADQTEGPNADNWVIDDWGTTPQIDIRPMVRTYLWYNNPVFSFGKPVTSEAVAASAASNYANGTVHRYDDLSAIDISDMAEGLWEWSANSLLTPVSDDTDDPAITNHTPVVISTWSEENSGPSWTSSSTSRPYATYNVDSVNFEQRIKPVLNFNLGDIGTQHMVLDMGAEYPCLTIFVVATMGNLGQTVHNIVDAGRANPADSVPNRASLCAYPDKLVAGVEHIDNMLAAQYKLAVMQEYNNSWSQGKPVVFFASFAQRMSSAGYYYPGKLVKTQAFLESATFRYLSLGRMYNVNSDYTNAQMSVSGVVVVPDFVSNATMTSIVESLSAKYRLGEEWGA